MSSPLSVLGEPVARLPDRRGLRAHAGTAIAGGTYCVCPQPGDVAAGPAAEAGGPRRPLGPPRGSASAALDAAPRGVAAHRTRAGRARRIAHPLRRAHLLPGRHGPLRRRGCRCPTPRVRHAPPVGCSNPGSACRRRCPRPIPAPITPFGGRIWTFGRVEERRVAGRGSVAYPALSQPGRRPSPMGTFPPPPLRTRRADFRHRALQWNHAARARASRSRPADGFREPWHQARTLAPAGRCVVRPVDALATATARVIPFACACDNIRHSCSSPG